MLWLTGVDSNIELIKLKVSTISQPQFKVVQTLIDVGNSFAHLLTL